MLLFSRQGKLRLQKWYVAHPDKTKKKITRDLITTILARKPKMCSFLEWKDLKIVYKRYELNLKFSNSLIPLLCEEKVTNPYFVFKGTRVYISVALSSKVIMNY